MLLRDNVYGAIRNAILTCEYRPGEELREQILAERFHVSRSPIRDSLLRLEQENLVTVLPRQGYQVRPVSIPDVQDIFALQLLLEPACAAAAAAAGETDVQSLNQFRGFVIDGKEEWPFLQHNEAFHRAVADLSGNKRMAALAHDLSGQLARLVCVSLRVSSFRYVCGSSSEHDAIIDAIQAHDVETAAKLAYEHAATAHVRINEALRILEADRRQLADVQTSDPDLADSQSPAIEPLVPHTGLDTITDHRVSGGEPLLLADNV